MNDATDKIESYEIEEAQQSTESRAILQCLTNCLAGRDYLPFLSCLDIRAGTVLPLRGRLLRPEIWHRGTDSLALLTFIPRSLRGFKNRFPGA